jgi:hypothetical protein
MTNKTRLSKLEARMIPPGAVMVVWADPDQEGIYYDTPNSGPDRKTYTDKDLDPIRNDPRDVLLVVKRDPMKI